ncbi:MAG TPA: hypothetical protein VEX68_10980 [Bryobacteraceae bacterium]|nr:hypothetical protein [Bryobacteraceae bacterium]
MFESDQVMRWTAPRLLCWCSIFSIFGRPGDMLDAVKQKVIRDLTKLPDYVCTETIEQSRIGVNGEPADTNRIRLDVGYAQGKQIFGWPGGESLSEFDVSRLVPGLVSDGEVLALAKLLLLSEPVITGQGPERHEGRATIPYDYRVTLEYSGWVATAPN